MSKAVASPGDRFLSLQNKLTASSRPPFSHRLLVAAIVK
jgi:hypothetical protein